MGEVVDAREDARGTRRQKVARQGSWMLTVGILTVLVALYFTWSPFREVVATAWTLLSSGDREGFARWIDGFGAAAPVVILASYLLQTLAAFVPSLLIMVVSVLAFGPVWGGVMNVVGLMMTAAVAYGIGWSLGLPVVQGVLGDSTEKRVEEWVERYGFWTVVVFRFTPTFSSDAISYVGGVLQMGFFRFMAATAVGVAPLAVLVSWFGEEMDRLQTGVIWVGVVTGIGLIGWIAWDRWRR